MRQVFAQFREIGSARHVLIRYEASLAERRYAACDPDNRLIAAQLEKSLEATLRRVEACEVRLNERQVR